MYQKKKIWEYKIWEFDNIWHRYQGTEWMEWVAIKMIRSLENNVGVLLVLVVWDYSKIKHL